MAARNIDTAYPLILRAERHYAVKRNDTLLYFTRYLKADILYDKLLYKRALPVYQSLIRLGERHKLPLLAESHMGLASMYLRESNIDSALYHFRIVEHFDQYPLSEQLLSALYFNMASCFQYNEAYAAAEVYHFKSLDIKERLKDSLGIASAYLNMGDLYFDEYKEDTAAFYLAKCLEIATRLNNFQLLESANYNLFKVNQSQQRYQEALAYLEQSLVYKDSIWNRDKVWKIADQQKKFEVQQKQVEILKLENEKIVKDAEIKTRTLQRNSTLVGVICLLLFISFGIVAYNNKARANRKILAQNKIIDEQNNQKAVLLGEIHHRVKNNLEMLQSMLILQMRQYRDDESVQQALNEANNRIQSIALLHKQLYNGDLANTSGPEYFKEIFARILDDTNARRQVPIRYRLDIDPVSFKPDNILPLALLVNEWITNSIKYAFNRKQEDALICFSLKKQPSGQLEVFFADNGENAKEEGETREGFGSRLINSLVRQLKGQLEASKTGTGWQYKLTLDYHG